MEQLLKALQQTTQALKDILAAADNGQPYTSKELHKNFTPDYNAGHEALAAYGTAEGKPERFPNGFDSWMDTHFEVVQHITITLGHEGEDNLARRAQEADGHGGLWQLAEELTDEFEAKWKGEHWGMEREFYDTIEEFLEEKEGALHGTPPAAGGDIPTPEPADTEAPMDRCWKCSKDISRDCTRNDCPHQPF
jgi:hypothetical protein